MILVAGGTGKIGSALVKQLASQGQKVRVLARDPAKAASLKGPNVEVVAGDLEKPETLPAAFKGVEKVFVVMAAGDNIVSSEKNAWTAAKQAGVKHAVKLSTAGADAGSPINLGKWHGTSENNLKQSGVPYTILQPIMFMQNIFMSADSIKREGKFYGAFKNGRIPSIDITDIAASAAAVLTGKGHEGKTYFLTGPEPLTQKQWADKLSSVLGKTVQYVDIPSSALVDNLKKAGMPDWFATDFGKMNDWFASDAAANPSADVEKLTGRKPRTVDAFLKDAAPALR